MNKNYMNKNNINKKILKFNKVILLLFLVLAVFVYSLGFNSSVIASTSYYSSISNTATGDGLKSSLRSLITNTHTYKSSYEDCKDPSIVEKTDGDPNNSGNIILFWSGLSIDSAWDGGTSWNREHMWPQSQSGGLYGTSGAGSDLHHIRPTDPSTNGSHGNNPYGVVSGDYYVTTSTTNGSVVTDAKCKGGIFEPGDSKKGDTARIIFYLMVRYSSLENIVDNVATSLDLLLEWNRLDPVDSSEIRRNNAVADIQGNRNPFIDNSNYANLIWDPENAETGGGTETPDVNYYPVTVEHNANECDVTITGTKNDNNYYTGNVTINVTPKAGYTYLGLKDINTNAYVTTGTTYTISNISQSYYLQAVFTTTENASYELVTDVTNLEAGDNIIIAALTSNYALSTNQKTNNRGQVGIEKSGNVIASVDELQNIVLENGNITGTFAFNVGGYLCSASSTANYLRTENSITNNSSWTIAIAATGAATIKSQGDYSRNLLRYNSTSSLFACYSSGQQDVAIYEKIAQPEETPEEKALKEFQMQSTFTSLMVNYNVEKQNAEGTYSYVFESKKFYGNETLDLGGINWTLDCNGGYWGYDSTKGQQIGSGSSPAKYATLTSTSLTNIKSIKVNVSGASNIAGTCTIKVGGNQVGDVITLTSSATEYTFDNLNLNGEVQLSYSQTSSKAVYVKSIEIVYGTDNSVYTLNSAALRFGSYISKDLYDTLNNSDIKWGVEYNKGNITDWSASDIRVTYLTPAQVSAPNASVEDENGEYYQFALVIKNIPYDSIGTQVSARLFVEYEEKRYYMTSTTKSVKELANIYLQSTDTNEFSEHLGILNHIVNYEG